MKLIFAALIFTFSTIAHAGDVKLFEPAPPLIVDSEVGTINIQLFETSDPVFSPFLLTVTATCLDKRSHPDATTPKADVILKDFSICQYRKPGYNFAKGVLTLHYSTSPAVAGVAKCATRSQQDFDLREHCAQWLK